MTKDNDLIMSCIARTCLMFIKLSCCKVKVLECTCNHRS